MPPETDAADPSRAYRARRYTAEDGLRLFFRDYGDPAADATPVLCLTGLTRNSRDFHALATRLSSTRRVVCPDYRGRGLSDYDPDWRHYEPATYLNDIRHLLALANLHRVVVIGTSLGGLLAMAMAVAMPGALAGVVINDASPELDPDGLGRILDYIGRDRPQPDWASAVREVRRLFPGVACKSDEEWLGVARGTYREGADGVLRFDWDVNIAKALGAPPPADMLWRLFRALRPFPTLALRGARSDIVSEAAFERMAAEHPRLERVLVPGVGHAPSLAEPEAAAAIDRFLAGL